QPIEHRLSHVMSGTPAAIAVTAYGDDLAVLRSLAKELEAAIKAVPGTRDVLANREVMITSLPVRYRPQDLAAAGLSPAEAARQVQHAIAGAHAVDVIDGSRRIALTVRLHPDERADVDDVGALELRGGSGARVRLRDVADLGRERASNLIARENGRRKAVVSCNVADGHNLGDVAVAIERAVAPIVAGAGCALALGGQFEAQQSASRTILGMGAIALVVMLLLLHGALGSLPAALLVMVNLPLALIGGVAAVYLTAGPGGLANTLALLGISGRAYEAPVLSSASLVGFITLFGIAVRNGILMVRHFLDLMREGVPAAEAVARGAHERLVPILMTALCATLGLLPIVLAAGEPGSEILAPLSVVVLGGLVTSTLLNLLVVPAGFLLLVHDRTLATRPDDADLLAPRRRCPRCCSPPCCPSSPATRPTRPPARPSRPSPWLPTTTTTSTARRSRSDRWRSAPTASTSCSSATARPAARRCSNWSSPPRPRCRRWRARGSASSPARARARCASARKATTACTRTCR
ncbi:MAG: efflux RND transporter permease subunit, partial [Planctomycetota bacterium]